MKVETPREVLQAVLAEQVERIPQELTRRITDALRVRPDVEPRLDVIREWVTVLTGGAGEPWQRAHLEDLTRDVATILADVAAKRQAQRHDVLVQEALKSAELVLDRIANQHGGLTQGSDCDTRAARVLIAQALRG